MRRIADGGRGRARPRSAPGPSAARCRPIPDRPVAGLEGGRREKRRAGRPDLVPAWRRGEAVRQVEEHDSSRKTPRHPLPRPAGRTPPPSDGGAVSLDDREARSPGARPGATRRAIGPPRPKCVQNRARRGGASPTETGTVTRSARPSRAGWHVARRRWRRTRRLGCPPRDGREPRRAERPRPSTARRRRLFQDEGIRVRGGLRRAPPGRHRYRCR